MKRIRIIAIVFTAFMASCSSNKEAKETVTEIEPKVLAEEPAEDNEGGHVHVLECMGYVDVPPSSSYAVHALAEGYLRNVKLLEGSAVYKGQALAVLESPEFPIMEQQLLQAFAEWEYSQAEYTRLTALDEKQAISKSDMEQARRDYKLAQAAYEGQKMHMTSLGFDVDAILQGRFTDNLVIRSPASGVVTRVHATNGQLASVNDHLFSIVDPSHYHIELQVPAADISKIKVGDKFHFFHPASDTILTGEIHLVNKEVDQNNLTINVHGHLDDEEVAGALTVGERLFVQVDQVE